MTLILELAPGIQQALLEEARRQGTTPEMLAAQELRSRFVKPKADTEAVLRLSLARLLEKAKTLALQPLADTAKYTTEFGEILREKYRKQGHDV